MHESSKKTGLYLVVIEGVVASLILIYKVLWWGSVSIHAIEPKKSVRTYLAGSTMRFRWEVESCYRYFACNSYNAYVLCLLVTFILTNLHGLEKEGISLSYRRERR